MPSPSPSSAPLPPPTTYTLMLVGLTFLINCLARKEHYREEINYFHLSQLQHSKVTFKMATVSFCHLAIPSKSDHSISWNDGICFWSHWTTYGAREEVTFLHWQLWPEQPAMPWNSKLSRNKEFYCQDLWLLWKKYKAGEGGWTGLIPENGALALKILGNNWFSAWKTWLAPRSFQFYFLPLTIFGKVTPCKTKGEIAGTKYEIKYCLQPIIKDPAVYFPLWFQAAFCEEGLVCPASFSPVRAQEGKIKKLINMEAWVSPKWISTL